MSELAGDLLARPGTTRECLRAALRFIVDFDLAQQSPRGCLVGNTAVELAGHDPEIARTIRGMQDRQVGVLSARIRQGQRDGDVGPGVDARAAAEVAALITFLASEAAANIVGADVVIDGGMIKTS